MKLRFSIQVLLFMASFAIVSLAQVKTLTQAEYEETTNTAFKATLKKVRRVTTTTMSFQDGKRNGTETLIEEFIPPDVERSLMTVRAGSKVTTSEIIEIGDAKYKRANSGIWSKWIRTKKPIYTLKGIPSADEPREITKYTWGESRLNGQLVVLFSRTSNKAYGFASGAQQNRIWISKDGFVLKTEETVGEDDPNNVAEKTIAIYEYDPKGLKIEVPIK
jgi:hypothetical protein